MRIWPVVLLLSAGCGAGQAVPTQSQPEAEAARAKPAPAPPAERLESPHLENLFRVRPGIYSGGQPEGDAGFAELQKLSIKTIISVDGAWPDVERAAVKNMRYVHLPVGYDGISKDQAWRIARAVRDLPQPVYLHCHHGKHRGPAAVAAALLCLEPGYAEAEVDAWMRTAGTDPKYRGLVELPRRLTRPKVGELDGVAVTFTDRAAIQDFTAIMVKIDERWETLKAAKKVMWTDPDAAIVATLLAEHYREAARLDSTLAKGPAFAELLTAAEKDADELSAAVRARDAARADAAFARGVKACGTCHAKFRD